MQHTHYVMIKGETGSWDSPAPLFTLYLQKKARRLKKSGRLLDGWVLGSRRDGCLKNMHWRPEDQVLLGS